MSLPWFRLYRELKDDPKVGLLDDSSFRVFIESLCWACEKADGQGGTGLTMENASWAYRRNVTVALHALIGNGMLALKPSGEIMVPKWEDRQKMSDSSAERVRKYREKKSVTLPVTLHVTECNALEENRIDENRVKPPKVPQGGQKGPIQLRAEAIFKRKPETPLTTSEATAFRKNREVLKSTGEDDWRVLEQFYAAPQSETFSRKDLATLVNNWNGEIDRAKAWCAPNRNGTAKKSLAEKLIDEL